MLLLAMDDTNSGMSDRQARDEAITLFIAGYETNSNALTWTLHLLSQYPEVLTRLQEEVDSVLQGRAPTFEDLRGLSYTDMALKEALRLRPPVWAILRQVVEDMHIGGYIIPKGSYLELSPHATHRDARWFPEPEKFLPERFSEGWEKRIPKSAYFPFGMGPRVCIGQAFANMEAQIILAMIVQRCELSLVPGQQIVAQPLIAQRPRYGLRMVVTERQPELATMSA